MPKMDNGPFHNALMGVSVHISTQILASLVIDFLIYLFMPLLCSPNEDFGRPNQRFRMRFPGKHFSTICSPNRVLTPLKSASKKHSETFGEYKLCKMIQQIVACHDAMRCVGFQFIALPKRPIEICSTFQNLRLGDSSLNSHPFTSA